MRQIFRLFATWLALTLLASAAAHASSYPNTADFGSPANSHAAWYRACMGVNDAAPPAADRPIARALQRATPCDAQLLYYDTLVMEEAAKAEAAKGQTRSKGTATRPDWTRVRACALETRDTAVLMMLYANGLGVQADPALALHYACSTPAAPPEMARRVNHLTRLPQEAAPAFDQCDDATTRLTINTCAAIAQRRNERAAEARLDKITARWNPSDKAALRKLRTALNGFADARGRHEADLKRTLGPAFAPAAETARAAEIELFLDDLTRFERGRLPSYTAAQYAGFSDQLGLAYRKLAGGAAGIAISVQQTEQAWARYRNAWVAFGRVHYPAVPAHAWEALLAKRRIKRLRHLARELSRKRRR